MPHNWAIEKEVDFKITALKNMFWTEFCINFEILTTGS